MTRLSKEFKYLKVWEKKLHKEIKNVDLGSSKCFSAWIINTIGTALLSATSLFFHSDIASSKTTLKLPLLDGTYVSDQKLCPLTDEVRSKLQDRVGRYVREIRGIKISDSYELSCEIVGLKENGKKILINSLCESEGQAEEITFEWIVLGKSSFGEGSATFNRCRL
jgi:hypothetical protein